VYTALIELQTASDPMQRSPGTIQTNPGGVWNNPTNPRAQQPTQPQSRATVEYKLYRADGSLVSGAPFSFQQAIPEADVVGQVIDRIASKVSAEVKKAGPPPMQE
jgi:hypothetical protein